MLLSRILKNVPARLPLVAVGLATALLAACGGGDQQETFQPARIVAFGDENSIITPDGVQYSVNNFDAVKGSGIPCTNNPIWIQYVAVSYGLRFEECAKRPAVGSAVMAATPNATIAQTADVFRNTHLDSKTLVTLMVGTHDIVNLVSGSPGATNAQLRAAARQLGGQLGQLVLAIIATDARIIVATVPNLGQAPISKTAPFTAALMTQLSADFNDGLNAVMSTVPSGGGRNGVILEVDQLIGAYVRNENQTYSSITNRVDAACAAVASTDDLPGCTSTNTGFTDPLNFLWAGRVQLGAITHSFIGQEASTRVKNNPL